jgi:putative transposase
MPRFKRTYYQNVVYHVYFRGNNRHPILKSKYEKFDLLASIKQCQERKGFKLYAFAIMNNHAHMIIEVNELHNISKVMQSILLSYSTKYRRKNDYVGHVWQGRFQSKPISDERYMIDCLNYVHNNPIEAGVVSKAIDYQYSSARFYEGLKSKEVQGFLALNKYGDSSTITY